jgi:acetyl-CoA carboxylase biotin carboxyl carrier protein
VTTNSAGEPGADPLVDCAGISATDLESVLSLVAGTDVVELDVSFGSSRVALRRPPLVVAPAPSHVDGVAAEPKALAIASPLVGIFRASVKRGDVVQQGHAIGAIEALGMPTSVDAPQSGTVEDLLVQDGSPVEYGQPLIVLRRANE